MSARPGLCGGHRATGVPTAIDSFFYNAATSRLSLTYPTAGPKIQPK